MRRAIRLLILCLSTLLGFAKKAAAVDVPVMVAKLEGSQSQLVVGAQAAVDINVGLNNLANIASVNSVMNVITFKINEESPLFFGGNWGATLIYRTYFENANGIIDSTNLDTLTVNYDLANTYRSRSSKRFYGGYKVTVKILQITTSSAGNQPLPALVLLNEMYVNVDYTFDCFANAVNSISYTEALSQADELYVSWPGATGADEYDLEWAYIDSTALQNYKVGGVFNAALIYDNNGTRVTITNAPNYKIPLLYDHSGILFFRVRSVQNKSNGKRVETVWSSAYNAGGLGQYSFYGHQRALNWQASTSYAEEGKRKSVVQYFDGSLRGRQTVTKDNSLGTTIVAETFYDYQGRPVINVLPAPTLSTIIAYSQNFNVGINGGEYDKGKYDTLISASAYCGLSADSMSNQSGAAKYYSNNNPEATTAFHQFIPNANGFPFVESQYTQDNTGRLTKQSGVGTTHKLGSGHETVYYYGLPSQKELDGLFGTEAGDYTHYQKNMVRDANGQYSVSYVDMNGRTIATALAGQQPASLDQLPSYSLNTVTEPLITPASNMTDGLSMSASKGLLIPKAGDHRFVYSLLPDSISLANCNNVNICYDCYYNLEITITNDCNNTGFPNNQPIIITRSNLTLNPLDTICNSNPNFPAVDTTINLAEGSYLVTKKLTVSRQAMEYYRDSVFLRNNTCTTKEQFIQQVLDSIRLQPSNCNPDCASCLSSVGTWESFHATYMQQSGYALTDTAAYRGEAQAAYKNALDVCTSLCNSGGDDEAIRRAMLWDVSPSSGQYANPDSANTYSIFYTGGSPVVSGFTPHYADPSITYLNENGQPDFIVINGQSLTPQQLQPHDFAARFKSSWAEALLKFHPEFCKLQKYQRYSDSHSWDNRFASVNTYGAAKDSGFLNPTGGTYAPFTQFPTAGIIRDPLFNKGYTLGGVSIKQMMQDSMTSFRSGGSTTLSMWALATLTAKCKVGELSCMDTYASNSNAFDANSLCEGELDMAWRSFSSFYANTKRTILRKLIDSCGTINLGYYQPRFIDPDAYLPQAYDDVSDAGQASSDAQNAMAANYVSNCQAYADQWIHQLSQCGSYDTAQLRLHVIPKLIQVCIKGSDGTHPYGSSTLSPDSSYTYNSFEEVMTWYNNSIGLSSTAASTCNGYLISAPKPYNQPTVYAQLPVWNKPDSCTCAKINELYSDYQTNNSSYTNFSAYLLAVHRTIISQGALDTLRGLCSGTITCNYLPSPILLPAALQCGVTTACINCEQMRNGYAMYRLQFPGNIPQPNTNDDTTQGRINVVFANFMNAQFGFSYGAGEYLAFMQECKIGTSAFTDTLWNRIADFRSYYLTTPQNQVWRTWKISPWTKIYINSLNAVLKATQNPLNPQLPAGYGLSPFSTSLNSKLKSVIKSTSNPADSSYHTIVPFPLQYTFNSFINEFAHLNTNVVKPYHFVTGTASAEELSYKYFAVATRPVLNFFNNVWSGTANYGAYPYYGMSTPDSTFIPWYASGFYSWENHIQSLAFYKPGLSVNDPATYSTYHYDSVYVGTWWGDYGNNTIAPNQIKQIRNVRFDPTVLPLADMYNFAQTPTGVKVTLDLIGGGQTDAYIYATYFWTNYFIYKETVDSNLYNPDCKTAFTYFFNQRGGTSYTTAQIDAIYSANGITYDYCSTAADTSKLLCGKTEVFQPNDPNSSNCIDSTNLAIVWGTELYNAYVDSLKVAFENAYLKKCLNAFNIESFTVTRPHSEYHYTLYYYDQAGNLVKTVPPKGVDNRIGDATFINEVQSARASGGSKTPNHTLPTQYRYNTLNQVVAQHSPDGGTSRFWYDRLGRLVVSQNAKQWNSSYNSYTLYDALGRIKEVGEIYASTNMTDAVSRNAGSLQSWITNGYKTEITRTVYDIANATIEPELHAKNLRNRVAYTQVVPIQGNDYESATYYSYDIHGNVDTLLQDYKETVMAAHSQRFKKMVYRYDLISGKVNNVAYQPALRDAFYHKYEYDAENKLTAAYTSTDSIYWERDGQYSYYKHGPLARTVIGQQSVQGLDYAYTLQGWLKGVNGTLLCEGKRDMGGDGAIGGVEQITARDAFGFSLHYYSNDYAAIGKPYAFNGAAALSTKLTGTSAYSPLYNGNISSMAVNIEKLAQPAVYNYRYDQLNRIKLMEFLQGANTCDTSKKELWDNGLTQKYDFGEEVSYDPNGNITRYKRRGNATQGMNMDDMEYNYYSGTNRLERINDIGDPNHYSTDIDNQGGFNYQYDAIGNLVVDQQADIAVEWNVYGKIRHIGRYSGGASRNIDYTYDASGNRIGKTLAQSGTTTKYTWYVRDASGNVMAVYFLDGKFGSMKLEEQHLYGSSRLGVLRPAIDMEAAPPATTPMGILGTADNLGWERGLKSYELSNHLGNVLVTVRDKKKQYDSDSNGDVDWYEADVASAQDYYPFGMLMPGRQYTNGTGYRYGFNGQEKSDEIKGEGNSYTAEFWEYDPRSGRRWNMDPRPNISLSPYSAFQNNPIWYMDPKGDTVVPSKNISQFVKTSKGFNLFSNTAIYKKLVAPYDISNPSATDANNTTINFSVDKNRATDFGYTSSYIVGKDGVSYYLDAAGAPKDSKSFFRQSKNFISKNFDQNSKMVYYVAINPGYYEKTNAYTTATVWGHETFVHLERQLENLAVLRRDGILAFKEAYFTNSGGLKDHYLVYNGYKTSFIQLGNEIGIKLKSISAVESAIFKTKFIKTGIEYYEGNSKTYLKDNPNVSPPTRRNPNSYLKF